MFGMQDIYYKVGKGLFEKGYYYETELSKKKELIDLSLKEYVIEKIMELNPSFSSLSNPDASVVELASILGNLVPVHDHFATLRHLTHYVLQVAGDLQGFSIIWFQENDEARKENSLIDFNDFGYWDKLVTYDEEEMNLVQIFTFVYTFFEQQFLEKESIKTLKLSYDLKDEN
ncbi:MAG: hypothetical protein E7168_02425 [Firmicutes bacterium]|nr:hypothetical protein [Bacillota bacterium]